MRSSLPPKLSSCCARSAWSFTVMSSAPSPVVTRSVPSERNCMPPMVCVRPSDGIQSVPSGKSSQEGWSGSPTTDPRMICCVAMLA